jgi:hypothetical protein
VVDYFSRFFSSMDSGLWMGIIWIIKTSKTSPESDTYTLSGDISFIRQE